MATPTDPLPAQLREALQQGRLLEAIQLLSRAARARSSADASDHGFTGADTGHPSSTTILPPEVVAALQQGKKIEAVRLLRQKTGMDLKASKRAVDAFSSQPGAVGSGLSPGEVPRSRFSFWWVVAVLLLAAIALRAFLRTGG